MATMQEIIEGELPRLREVLRSHGYDPEDAGVLSAEGIGPAEAEIRASVPGNGVGSLEFTHGLRRRTA